MRRAVSVVLALAALAVVGAGGWQLWRNRPWRTAVSVNGHALSVGELRLRAAALLDDARRVEHLVVAEGREAEALLRYRRQAAQMWIVKEVLLSEAVARGYSATPDDEKEALAQVAARLKGRNLTPEDFFREGPLSEDQKRRDFREGVLINKFTAREVRDVIVISPKEIDARLDDLQKWALLNTKPGEKVRRPPTRKMALDMLRAERFRKGFRLLFRKLFEKSDVKSPEFPDLESLDAVSPASPEDNDNTQESK